MCNGHAGRSDRRAPPGAGAAAGCCFCSALPGVFCSPFFCPGVSALAAPGVPGLAAAVPLPAGVVGFAAFAGGSAFFGASFDGRFWPTAAFGGASSSSSSSSISSPSSPTSLITTPARTSAKKAAFGRSAGPPNQDQGVQLAVMGIRAPEFLGRASSSSSSLSPSSSCRRESTETLVRLPTRRCHEQLLLIKAQKLCCVVMASVRAVQCAPRHRHRRPRHPSSPCHASCSLSGEGLPSDRTSSNRGLSSLQAQAGGSGTRR